MTGCLYIFVVIVQLKKVDVFPTLFYHDGKRCASFDEDILCFCFLCFAKKKKKKPTSKYHHRVCINILRIIMWQLVDLDDTADCVPLSLHRWTLGPTTRSWPPTTPCSQLRLLDIENEKGKKCTCAHKTNLRLALLLQSSFALLYGRASLSSHSKSLQPPPPEMPTRSSRWKMDKTGGLVSAQLLAAASPLIGSARHSTRPIVHPSSDPGAYSSLTTGSSSQQKPLSSQAGPHRPRLGHWASL